MALAGNGVDEGKRIVGAKAPTPYLFNVPSEFIERFRKQVTVIDLDDEGSPEVLRQAVCACYQESPTPFGNYVLSDPGAYPEPPLEREDYLEGEEPHDGTERRAGADKGGKARELMERIKRSVEQRKRGEAKNPCAPAEERG